MRVSDSIRYQTFKNNAAALKDRIDKNQQMVASQKKILSPSDDPVAMSKSIQLDAQKGMNNQYARNLNTLGMYGSMYETSLNTVQDSLSRAKQLAISANSDTMDAAGRKASAEEIKKMIEQLVAVGNTKVGNTYIFGGKKTSSPPFTLDLDPASPTYYSVTYNGTADVADVFVSSGQTEKLGISGQRIFDPGGGTDIFVTLKNFKDALENNVKTSIGNSITALDKTIDLTTTNTSYVGTYTGSIETITKTLQSNSDTLTGVISEMMDADMVDLISQYTLLTNAYEASLASMAKLQQMNVLNYLS
jgi:flagellar hook-associated protein 3 FlgL